MATAAKVPPVAVARVVERLRHHLYRLNQRLMPAPAAMMEMIVGTWLSQAITAAAELGVADGLAAGPMTIDELAATVGADSDALRRLQHLRPDRARRGPVRRIPQLHRRGLCHP